MKHLLNISRLILGPWITEGPIDVDLPLYSVLVCGLCFSIVMLELGYLYMQAFMLGTIKPNGPSLQTACTFLLSKIDEIDKWQV